MSSHADTIRRVLLDAETSTAPLDALLAENQWLREALEEACDWLDADLACDPKPSTFSADSELVASWRKALAAR